MSVIPSNDKSVGDLVHGGSKFVYTWKIPNFSTYKGIIKSPILAEHACFKWQLQLHPDNYYGKGDAAVLIHLVEGSSIEVEIKLSLVDGRQEKKHQYIKMHEFDENSPKLALLMTMNRGFLMDPEQSLLINNCLTIRCEVGIKLEKPVFEHRITAINGSQTRLGEFDDFEKIFNCCKYSDITFIVDGISIFAHKCILECKSEVFAAMFNTLKQEKDENIVIIDDIRYGIFLKVLKYVYSGKICNIDILADQVIVVAEKYSLSGLKNLCIDTLCKNVALHNVLKYLNIADSQNALSLKETCIKFIAEHKKQIIVMPEFKLCSQSLLFEILKVICSKN